MYRSYLLAINNNAGGINVRIVWSDLPAPIHQLGQACAFNWHSVWTIPARHYLLGQISSNFVSSCTVVHARAYSLLAQAAAKVTAA
uniref:Uncharacterized protein n=1 Tax=Timema bartmani TaxID=61472 RepID=A0A7R9F7E8_9NEOP|nr:unnamed protein product [Timema bartmani]